MGPCPERYSRLPDRCAPSRADEPDPRLPSLILRQPIQCRTENPRVSTPREVLPGRTYMITRRCTQRQFLMRPDRETNNAFIYCLAVAAEKFGIRVLFTAAMSNHHHTGIHDPEGNYPAFIEHFHKLFAKCQNAL